MSDITDDPNAEGLTHGTDSVPVPQAQTYLVLSEEEREKGFLRPLRYAYWHTTCGTITTMGAAIAETYASRPFFYGATYCVNCAMHRPVGPEGEFHWVGELGQPPHLAPKVGT